MADVFSIRRSLWRAIARPVEVFAFMDRLRFSGIALVALLVLTRISAHAGEAVAPVRSADEILRQIQKDMDELRRRMPSVAPALAGDGGPATVEPVPGSPAEIQAATSAALAQAAQARSLAVVRSAPTARPVLRDRYGRRLRPAISIGGGGRSADGVRSYGLNDAGEIPGGLGSRMDTAPGESDVAATVDLLMRSHHLLPVRDHATNFLELDLSDYAIRRPNGARLNAYAAGTDAGDEEKDAKTVGLNPDLYVSLNMSGASDTELADLERGAYDPKEKGFYSRAGKFELPFAVQGWVGRVAGEYVGRGFDGSKDQIRLEKAQVSYGGNPFDLYRVDREHPYRFTVGQYKTDFGFYNSIEQYLSEWTWLDAPVIAVRTMGAPMIGTGLQLEQSMPLPWESTLIVGAQNGKGAAMTSFLPDASSIGGIAGHPVVELGDFSFSDLVYSARFVNGGHLFDRETTVGLGLSACYGPNATGNEGETWIYGADLLAAHEWCGGRRWLLWQTEWMRRDAKIAAATVNAINYAADFARDQGLYSQLLFGFRLGVPCPNGASFQELDVGALAFGLRYERAWGDGDSVVTATGATLARNADPLRDDRERISLVGTWQPGPGAGDILSHFGLTVQYNFDHARHLGKDIQSVFVGIELTGN